jgi:hypothetical protein
MSARKPTHSCCSGFTRSQLLRNAAAEAGKGLPAIEPGMPEPAGTGLSRRKFLSRSAGLALAVYGASKIPLSAFETGIAQAAPTDKILISVFLEGGIDAMSVLAPVGDPKYAQLRPNLAFKPGDGPTFSEDTRLQWHPAAAGLATLHEEGKVSAFPAIGYDHPDQSHFTSRHYYEIGELQVGYRTGWLGRYLDLVGDDENPLQGLSLDGDLSPMLATAEKPVAAIDSVDGYELWSPTGDPVEAEMFRSFARFGSLPSDSPGLAQVRRATSQTDKLRQELAGSANSAARSPIPKPGSPTSSPASPPISPSACRCGWSRSTPRAATTPTPTRRPTSNATCARPAKGCSPSSATSRRADSPTGSWSSSGASSGAGRRRTARSGPTTAPPATPS